MSMPKRCWPARRSIKSIWWVRLPKIIGGKHERTTAMPSAISQSIGNANKPVALRDRSVTVGHPPGRVIKRLSRLNFVLPPVVLVQYALSVPRPSDEASACGDTKPILPEMRLVNASRLKSFHKRTRNVQGSRECMRKRVRTMGLRRSRYIGEPRTHLQHVATAAALNLCRLHDWLTGISPHCTPLSHFARFMKEIA